MHEGDTDLCSLDCIKWLYRYLKAGDARANDASCM